MSLTTLDQIAAALTYAQRKRIRKTSVTSKGAGHYHSLWKQSELPAAGSTPPSGNGEVPTYATTGAVPFTNPDAGELTYLDKIVTQLGVIGTAIVYDRLFHNSGLSGTSIVAQSFTQPALTRATDGLGVEIWLEVYTAFGATGTTFTVGYTNEAGVAGRSAVLAYSGGAPVAGQLIGPFPLQSGDKGVLSVQSVTLSISTGTAGDFGVMLAKPIAEVANEVANSSFERDVIQLGHPRVENSACLAFMILCSSTSTGTLVIPSLMLNQG